MTALHWSLTLFYRNLSVHQWTTHFTLTWCHKSTVLLSGAQTQKKVKVKVILKRPRNVEIQVIIPSIPCNFHVFVGSTGVCMFCREGFTQGPITHSTNTQREQTLPKPELTPEPPLYTAFWCSKPGSKAKNSYKYLICDPAGWNGD